MPRKKTNPGLNVLDLLSDERRRELLNEVAGSALTGIIAGAKTFGDLVERLRGHGHWSILQHVTVDSIVLGGAPVKRGPGRPRTDTGSQAPTPAVKATKPTGNKRGPVKAGGDLLQEKLLDYIKVNPGKRTEEIKTGIGRKDEAVNTALGRLRAQNLVKTAGQKRGTTYTATGSSAPATAALVPTATASAPSPKTANGTKKKSKKWIRRTPEQIAKTLEEVLAFVAKNPGLNTESVVKKLEGDATAISDALGRLRADKKIKSTGKRRGMTYEVA